MKSAVCCWLVRRLSAQPSPRASWRSKRYAEVHLAGRIIAIEVELTAKTEERWQEILAARAARYDQVWYFTSAALRRDLGRALDALEPKGRAKFSLSLVNGAAYRGERPQP